MIQALEILSTTTNSTGSLVRDMVPGGAFQATITGTGTVSCVVTIQVSLDTVNWMTLGTISLSGTTTASEGFTSHGSWYAYRAVTTAVTGTVSSIKVNMSVVS